MDKKLTIFTEEYKNNYEQINNKILNNSFNSIRIHPKNSFVFDDLQDINKSDNFLTVIQNEKYYNTLINILNNKDGFKSLEIDNIYDIDTFFKLLQDNYKFNLKLSFELCDIKSLFKLPEILKNNSSNLFLKINVFEYDYYEKYNDIFQKYRYYYNNNHNIHFLGADYDLLTEYTQEELNDIYTNSGIFYNSFYNIIQKEMNNIIDDFNILVEFLKQHKNITLQINFNYMFRENKNILLFNQIFYNKYGEELNKNIIFSY